MGLFVGRAETLVASMELFVGRAETLVASRATVAPRLVWRVAHA
jgi:hypothetical protein